ncbi:MAG: ferritin [Armatimonadetes bacterium]|nr:ferritin [Armatimonadota bacterium]
MICEKVAKLLHEQIGHELGASQEYLATAVYFGGQGLDGWADEFYRQSDEERMHGMKIIKFLVDVDAEFTMPAIAEAHPTAIESPLDACQKALKWERVVTDQFRTMAREAAAEGDQISGQFLEWFLNEQIEEESTMDRYVKILESGLNPFQAEPLLGDPHADE